MDQEQLIRQIMAEVMKNLGNEQVTFAKKPASTSSAGRVGVKDYPLAEKHPDLVKTSSGKTLDELSFDKVKSGALKPTDFVISPQTLEMQAQVAEDAGRSTLARNLRRAAELNPVPDDRLLEIYNALRPYRSTRPSCTRSPMSWKTNTARRSRRVSSGKQPMSTTAAAGCASTDGNG